MRVCAHAGFSIRLLWVCWPGCGHCCCRCVSLWHITTVCSLSTSLCLLLETQQQADEIALAVKVTYESQGKPLLTIADAIEAKSFFKHPGAKVLQVGDAKGKEGSIVYVLCATWFILYLSDAIAKSAHQVKGTISCDSQYHFHMETQVQFNLYITIHWTCCSSCSMIADFICDSWGWGLYCVQLQSVASAHSGCSGCSSRGQ